MIDTIDKKFKDPKTSDDAITMMNGLKDHAALETIEKLKSLNESGSIRMVILKS